MFKKLIEFYDSKKQSVAQWIIFIVPLNILPLGLMWNSTPIIVASLSVLFITLLLAVLDSRRHYRRVEKWEKKKQVSKL